MDNREFQEKVLSFMSKIEEKLLHTVTDIQCKTCADENDKKISRIYWVFAGVIGTIGIIAKFKGLI